MCTVIRSRVASQRLNRLLELPDNIRQTMNTLGQTVPRMLDTTGNIVERTIDTTGNLVNERTVFRVLDMPVVKGTPRYRNILKPMRDTTGAIVEWSIARETF